MVIGIDALSLLDGGGLQHILRILSYPEIIKKYGFTKVIVWGNDTLIKNINKCKILFR